jgi:anti-sigma factor RsiW
MNKCEDTKAQMNFYLDNELRGSEVTALEEHLNKCHACAEHFDNERRFLEAIRESGPLHIARPELRGRIEHLLSQTPSAHAAPAALRARIQRSLAQLGSTTSRFDASWRMYAGACVVVLTLVGFWYLVKDQKNPANSLSEFAMMAVSNHQHHLRGELPLQTEADEPVEVSNWFTGKAAFEVRLPNYQESSGQERLYRLEGARLVNYRNDYAAYVAYRMHERPISLLMTSDSIAQPSGGEEIISKGITFHCDSVNGLKVISWSDRGLTYALVSDLEERGQQSCMLCHQGTKDRDFIQGLKP